MRAGASKVCFLVLEMGPKVFVGFFSQHGRVFFSFLKVFFRFFILGKGFFRVFPKNEEKCLMCTGVFFGFFLTAARFF